MDERLHGSFHLGSAGGHALCVVRPHVALRHLVQALLNDPQALPHLQHPHQVAVVAIAVGADRHVKVHQVICVVWLDLGNLSNSHIRRTSYLRFPKIPFDASASKHHTTASPVNRVLSPNVLCHVNWHIHNWNLIVVGCHVVSTKYQYLRDDSNVNDSLLEQSVVSDQVLHLIQPLAELGNELVDVIKKTNWDVLGFFV